MSLFGALILAGTLLSGAGFAASEATPGGGSSTLALARVETLEVEELPLSGREELAGPVPLTGDWRLVSSVDGVRTWEISSPVRPRTLFFHRPPDDMALLRRGSPEVDWADASKPKHRSGLQYAGSAGTWEFSTRALRVRRSAEAGPPGAQEYAVSYTKAFERERDLDRRTWQGRDLDFVQRSLQLDDTSRQGLLLPAPASVRHTLELPEGAVLDLGLVLLPPEAADSAETSDGATLVVEIERGGATTEVARLAAHLSSHRRHRVDLSGLSGTTATLRLRTEPGESGLYDYVFVTDPVVHVPAADPKRVALVFVDTLRPDHMSLYGASRPTTPRLDQWAADAAVFEEARSIAPWTLPSARTMLLGSQPERWEIAEGIHERLASEGWATGFFAGNVYLSSNFTMSRGWGEHRCINWPQASVQVDRAIDWLDDHPDQPAFVLLHLMDMHLPYTEPRSYRGIFAGETPEVLGDDYFLRGDVVRSKNKLGKEGKQYVRDRYDNNLRYVDDQLARFLGHFDDDDLVLIVSDHGEEFWDHRGFEHGHTLYDELLRVPMVVKGPGFLPGRHDTPTSLLDLAPTIAVAAGASLEGMQGLPLQAVADGSLGEVAEERAFAFGRPLYGDRQWGSLAGDLKYHSTEGKEQVYDLSTDGSELEDLRRSTADVEPLRQAIAEGLGRPVRTGYRLVTSAKSKSGVEITLRIPGGVAWAYSAEDPTNRASAEVKVEGETVKVYWPSSNRAGHEVFVVPLLDAEAIMTTLELRAHKGTEAVGSVADEDELEMTGTGATLYKVKDGSTTVRLTYAVVPGPLEDGAAVAGYNPEVRAELQALGYVEDDEPQDAEEPDPGPDGPVEAGALDTNEAPPE